MLNEEGTPQSSSGSSVGSGSAGREGMPPRFQIQISAQDKEAIERVRTSESAFQEINAKNVWSIYFIKKKKKHICS